MKLHHSITEIVTHADPERAERAFVGLQNGDLVVCITGTECGIITASVHSKDNKSYAVLIAPYLIECTCSDFYFRKPHGLVCCKHGISVVMKLQEQETAWQEHHLIHKAA